MSTTTKRPAEESGDAPAAKRPSLLLGPLDIGPALGEEDLNLKVLQIQNRKLSERLRERNRKQDQLESQVVKLEHSHDRQIQLLVALRRHLTMLKDHLVALLAPLGASSILDTMTEDLVASLGTVAISGDMSQDLEAVFESVFAALRCLGEDGFRQLSEGLRDGGVLEGEKLHSLKESHTKFIALLEDMKSRHDVSQLQQLQDKIMAYETKCEELDNALADARFDLQKSESRCDRLEVQLSDAIDDLRSGGAVVAGPSEKASSPASSSAETKTESTEKTLPIEEAEQLHSEILEHKALSDSRLQEIEELSQKLQECKKQLEIVKLDKYNISENSVRESSVFKSLQMQYSVVCQEASQVRACLEDAKRLLNSARSQHFMQLDEIRQEEIKYQMEVREEMGQLEVALGSAKHDYELLRIEFEKTVASNEQAAPIAKELQVTVDSLQKTIQQLKSEVTRYKTRAHKSEQQVVKLQEEVKEAAKEREQKEAVAMETAVTTKEEAVSTEVRNLQSQLKSALEEKASMETQLEGYHQAGKESRDKAELIIAEKKARAQVEELKKKFEEYRRDYEKRKEHLREESLRKAKALSEDHKHLQRELSAKKQEAQALVSEMECTAQAFDEMQEQNIRLLQQLKEKDDANFKLMSERIKSNSIQKLLMEEKELMVSQINALNAEQARLNDVMSHTMDKEKNTEGIIQNLEKEQNLQQQALDMHKKTALDCVQGQQEVMMKLSGVEQQVQAAQRALQSKTEECERDAQSLRRSHEEVSGLKRKLEKYKGREWASSSDEVLLEEIKTYKAKLNCPCCSARKKDTVLTKCFHVFCSECIRSRYDSRLRKCPKCGAAFGANDFHKIYLS